MAAIKYWVWLSALRMRPTAKQKLLEHFHGDPERLYFSTEQELEAIEGLRPSDLTTMKRRELETAMDILARCEMDHIDIVTLQDAAYPARLKNIYDPPVVLYVKGKLPVMDEEAAVAVVGTRDATPYGLKMARRFGHDLAACGGLVISGLTRGIDRSAAEGALEACGKVVGVLGTSHDDAHGGLYEDVAVSGALVSEYPPGQKTYREQFRYRNRVTAGLAVAALVVEAPEGSGAVKFAYEALEQGKDVFALPGNVDADNCAGSNGLLKEGARPVTAAWDVLSDFAPLYYGKLRHIEEKELKKLRGLPAAKPEQYADFVQVRVPNPQKVIDKPKPVEYIDLEKQLEDLTPEQLKIVSAMGKDPIHIDDLIDAVGMPAPAVLAELTMLQIDGVVNQEPGKRFILNITRG